MAASNQHIASFILSCLMLLNSGTNAIYSMEETCALYSEGYIADPSNCANWGYCKDGKVMKKGSCTDGFLYNSATGSCDYADDVNCVVDTATMCTGLNAVYKPDATNCKNYCYCENSKNAGCASCPETQVYNPTVNECVWPTDYDCPIDSACFLVPNNKYIADPNPANCGQYLRCANGGGVSSACSNSLVFNPSSGYCDTFTTMNCTGSNEGGGANPLTPAEIVAICVADPVSPAKEIYYTDGKTCGGYVACSAVGKGLWQKCKFGTHFDSGKLECVTPYTYDCPYDRCDNLNLKFVTALQSSCTKYYICQNQKATTYTSYSCARINVDYPYFDEFAGGCSKSIPTYAICIE